MIDVPKFFVTKSVKRSLEMPLTPLQGCTAAGMSVPAGNESLVDARSDS